MGVIGDQIGTTRYLFRQFSDEMYHLARIQKTDRQNPVTWAQLLVQFAKYW